MEESVLDEKPEGTRQPSIFEVIAQEALSDSIQPAVEHLVKFLYKLNPQRYKWLWTWCDELYAAFDLILENFYLNRFGGSFTEIFYGMKRTSTCKSAKVGFPKKRSLFMLVVWPYIVRKLEKIYSFLSMRLTASNLRRKSLAHIFVFFYPWIKALFSTWSLILKVAYMLTLCNIHSPKLKFANVCLEKVAPSNLKSFNEINKRKHWWTLSVLSGIITRCITYALYFIQFLDFYYNSDAGENFRTEQAKSVQKNPPAPHNLLRESSVLLLETNKCPLCLRQRINDTALGVSGYVFCYECIYSYVQNKKKCPVTSLPAGVDDLIRIHVKTT